ncbi:MAG TPA: type II toxin-antitoxin system VapC family toxin [Methylocella sp.]|nr:type II toxin-antitoxin system VapC family toxin [Methylocella sp.]
MFIDASVIVAILAREQGYEEIEKRLVDRQGPFFVSPLVKFEASAALARQKSAKRKPTPRLMRQAWKAVEAFVEDIAADEVSISPEIGQWALEASATYGKAIGHVADLNFGDCFAYACAKALNVPLLYKGRDFVHTDLG